MVLKVDEEVLDQVIKLTAKRLISFISIIKLEDIYFVEYESGDVNNSKEIIDIYVYLEKFKYALKANTLKNFYLYYSAGTDELITQFATTSANRMQMDLIQLLENNKYFIINNIEHIKVPSGKKIVKVTGEDLVNALIGSLKESLRGE